MPGIYPVKGYSVTIPVEDCGSENDCAPRMSLTDDEYKLVYLPYPVMLKQTTVDRLGLTADEAALTREAVCEFAAADTDFQSWRR